MRARFARGAGLLLPIALCTLAAHAVVYRSFFPAGPAHRYLGWFEPLIGALSLASLLAFGALVLLALGARESRLLEAVLRRVAWWLRAQGSGDLCARLVVGSVALLLCQESLERSLEAGGPEFAVLPASSWLSALAALGVLAALIAAVARSGHDLAQLVLGRTLRSRPRRAPAVARSGAVFAGSRRCNPLAERRGLRAPPLLAG